MSTEHPARIRCKTPHSFKGRRPLMLTMFALASAFAASSTALAQWSPCAGATGFNMQSLSSRGDFAFAGGATGAYRSSNGAVNFALSNSGNDASGPTRGFANDTNYIYTCTSQGVFRSADNGATWIAKSSGLGSLLGHGIHHSLGKLFHVGPAGVYRSDNQGDSWTLAGLGGIDVRCITSIDSVLFVGTNSNGIYRSMNSGATWTAVNTGLTSTTFRAI